jgi:hypothetical protein
MTTQDGAELMDTGDDMKMTHFFGPGLAGWRITECRRIVQSRIGGKVVEKK